MCDFEITQCVDYVRGMTAPAERGRMQRHLDEGCRECTAIVQFLGRVVAAAAGPPVPDDLVEGGRIWPKAG